MNARITKQLKNDFVNPSIADEFWTSISPTLATGGRAILTSTPNSDEDTFATIWKQAEEKFDQETGEEQDIGINGFHSFRHSVIDHLKQKGVEPHFINELVGHSQGNIDLDRYGKRYNPDILYNKCVKRIVYQTSDKRGIDFKSLKMDWKKIIAG